MSGGTAYCLFEISGLPGALGLPQGWELWFRGQAVVVWPPLSKHRHTLCVARTLGLGRPAPIGRIAPTEP